MDKKLILGILIVALVFCGCARQSAPAPVSAPTSTSAPSVTPVPRVIRPAVRSVDLVAFQSPRNGVWFSTNLDTLPDVDQQYKASFNIQDTPVNNRRNGQISPTLLAGYFFIQWDIPGSKFGKYAHTINALFIRSAIISFVDYPNNKVFLNWTRQSTEIPADIAGIIRVCNEKNIPVFLEVNYTDFIPGPSGTGVESLNRSDNIANTIIFIKTLESRDLHITGITFGDEIGDPSGYGNYQPTVHSSDLIGRFISYAKAIKTEFADLKIYAFDSYIFATYGQVAKYWDYFERIRQAEIEEGRILLDGFAFRESYVYMDEHGNVMDSQSILDDTESLYRNTPVYRYDVPGIRHQNQDTGYLPLIVSKTQEIFGRDLDIGITEYLPAGALYIIDLSVDS